MTYTSQHPVSALRALAQSLPNLGRSSEHHWRRLDFSPATASSTSDVYETILRLELLQMQEDGPRLVQALWLAYVHIGKDTFSSGEAALVGLVLGSCAARVDWPAGIFRTARTEGKELLRSALGAFSGLSLDHTADPDRLDMQHLRSWASTAMRSVDGLEAIRRSRKADRLNSDNTLR